MEKNIEKFKLVGGEKCKEILSSNPTYRVFWRSGYAYRGAGEREVFRTDSNFTEEMQRKYNWAAAIDIEVDHYKKEIHMNGFSENDMW